MTEQLRPVTELRRHLREGLCREPGLDLRARRQAGTSLTPKRAAVAGISCISPRAPLCERAVRLKLDSALMMEMIKQGSIPCWAAAS